MNTRFARIGVVGAIGLATSTLCQAAPVTTTIDVKCNGLKIGTLALTASDATNTGAVGSVKVKGGFKLTNAKNRDANCWCQNYNWLQIIKVSDTTFGPAMGHSVFVDTFPNQNTSWGGGASTEDFVPFYFNRGKGSCGSNAMSSHNGFDFYFEDGPSALLTHATAGAPFTFEAWLCLVCDNNTALSATGQGQDGSFGALACIKWGFTITKNVNGTFAVTRTDPVASTPAPADVTSALNTFNAAAGVGTWTQNNTFAACPPPITATGLGFTRAIPNEPGLLTAPTVVTTWDPATETITFSPAPVAVLTDTGLTPNPNSPFNNDPILQQGSVFGGASYHLLTFDPVTGFGLFQSDPNYVNVYFDDPNDLPDSKSSEGGPAGNPNGWNEWITGNAPFLIYDANEPGPRFFAPIVNPTFISPFTLFAQALQDAVMNAGNKINFYFSGQQDLGVITNGFLLPGKTIGSSAIGVTPPPPNPADLNGDGVVNATDLAILLTNWGPCPPLAPCLADINGDGLVNAADLATLLTNWG